MPRIRILLCAIAVALSLTACQHYASIGPGDYDVQQKLAVTLDRAWNRQVEGAGRICAESWTSNGPLLDMLCIVPGVAEGSPVIGSGAEAPRFRSGMTAADIVELVQTGLARSMQASDFVPISIAPATIAGREGFRFEFKFGAGQSAMETDRHALGYAFEEEKRLYLILFHAAEIHYFPQMKPIVEEVAASARLPRQRRT